MSVNCMYMFSKYTLRKEIIKPQNYSSPKINMPLYTGCWPSAK